MRETTGSRGTGSHARSTILTPVRGRASKKWEWAVDRGYSVELLVEDKKIQIADDEWYWEDEWDGYALSSTLMPGPIDLMWTRQKIRATGTLTPDPSNFKTC